MTTKIVKILTYIAGLILAMFAGVGCEPQFEPEVSQHELLMQYPTEYLDVPVGIAYEFGVSFQQVPTEPSKMRLLFDAEHLTITYDGSSIGSGQDIDVRFEDGKKRMRFNAIGRKAGVYKVEAMSDARTWTATGAFNITVKNSAYVVNLIDEVLPTIRVGEQRALNIEAIDVENPSHKFYNTPGFTVSARSLGDVPSIIDLGGELTWNNYIAPFENISLPLNWQDNKYIVTYKSFQPGEQRIEFTITSPRGDVSRTVHTLHVDSSKINLIPNRTAGDTVSVTEAYEVNYKVDYFGHPHNQLTCMWEPLPSTDPYHQSPKLFLDGKMDPEAWVWGEYRRPDVFGFSAYPIAANKGGMSKQGFRLRVQDMFGWDTTLEYRFDVKMSEFDFRVIAPTVTPLTQNSLYSCQFELTNYHNCKYRYKFVRPYDVDNTVVLYDYSYSTAAAEVWYDLDLSGSDGKRYVHSVQMGYASNIGDAASDGVIEVVIEDEFGSQRIARGVFRFEPNQVSVSTSQKPLSLVVGQSATFNVSLSAAAPDNTTFKNVTLEFNNYEPLKESIEVDGQPLPSSAPYAVTVNKKAVSVKYTAKSSITKRLGYGISTWTGQKAYNSIEVASIIDCGAFLATLDKSLYEIPYDDSRVSQDIALTLASEQELAGLYDYNPSNRTGTKISYTSMWNRGRLVAITPSGQEIALSSMPLLLEYVVGKTIKLRHYPDATVNGGSGENVRITVTRKDGVSAQCSYQLNAEDKSFVVEKFADWTKRTVNGKGTVNVSIRNLSKYYKGSYRLHSSEYYPGPDIQPNVIPTLTQELPLPKAPDFNKTISANIWETANRVGKVDLNRITIADDNGLTAWYENDGTDVYFYVEK